MKSIYTRLCEARQENRKQLAILVDPDKSDAESIRHLAARCREHQVDYIFAGGSLITNGNLHQTISLLRQNTSIPIILFPGSHEQIDKTADAILLLSLISGRNPEYLIGQHVTAAPKLQQSGLEILPTGYILVESGNTTTVQYISNTSPVPMNKPDIAAITALAGEQLGLRLIFADAGSGAHFPVSPVMIKSIREMISVPLITGGGIRTAEQAFESAHAGADLIVIGNAVEKNPDLISEIAIAVKQASGISIRN
jgi:putative glycerol-1-phosphate prenyltransferase